MRFQVQRDINIDVPIEHVHSIISDLRRWPDWSPWTVGRNHVADFSWSDDNKSFSWNDQIIGEGSVKKIKESDTELHFDLTFKNPFKSSASTSFQIKSVAKNRCCVSWVMNGKVPWFLFFLIPSIRGKISLDSWNGLAMLQVLAEVGKIDARYSDVQLEEFDELYVAGVTVKRCPMYAVGASQPNFKKIATDIKKFGTPSDMINVYQNFNIKTHQVDLTCGYLVDKNTFLQLEQHLKGEITLLSIEKSQAVKVVYGGQYRFIGNAWSLANSFLCHKKYKPNPALSGFEIYRVNPFNETDENKYSTDVFVAVKPS